MATSVSYGKMEILTASLVKSEPLRTICQDWLRRRGECLFQIWWQSAHGGLLDIRVKYNFLCNFLFIYFFFSRTNVQNRPLDGFRRLMAEKRGIKQGCAVLGKKWKIVIWPLFALKMVSNRQFPAKMLTHESQSISESTKPIQIKI